MTQKLVRQLLAILVNQLVFRFHNPDILLETYGDVLLGHFIRFVTATTNPESIALVLYIVPLHLLPRALPDPRLSNGRFKRKIPLAVAPICGSNQRNYTREPIMKNPLVADATIDHELETAGYARRALLSPDEVQSLRTVFSKLRSGPAQTGYQISIWNEELPKARAVGEALQKTLISKLAPYVKNFRHVWCSFVSKPPEYPESFLPPHRDWSFLKEGEGPSLGIWVPLVDTHRDNGAFGLIPGSHKILPGLSGSPSHMLFTSILQHSNVVTEFLQFQEMRAGELLIFDNRLLHGSLANCTKEDRVAAACMLIPEDADLVHYFLNPGTVYGQYPYKVHRYHISPDFFYRYSPRSLTLMYDQGLRPPEDQDSQYDQTIDFSQDSITEVEARKLLEELRETHAPRRFLHRVLSSMGMST